MEVKLLIMKKKNLTKRLHFNKQAVSHLNNNNLSQVLGGGPGGDTIIEPNDSKTYCGCGTLLTECCPTKQTYCAQYSCGCIPSVNYPCQYTEQPGCVG